VAVGLSTFPGYLEDRGHLVRGVVLMKGVVRVMVTMGVVVYMRGVIR